MRHYVNCGDARYLFEFYKKNLLIFKYIITNFQVSQNCGGPGDAVLNNFQNKYFWLYCYIGD